MLWQAVPACCPAGGAHLPLAAAAAVAGCARHLAGARLSPPVPAARADGGAALVTALLERFMPAPAAHCCCAEQRRGQHSLGSAQPREERPDEDGAEQQQRLQQQQHTNHWQEQQQQKQQQQQQQQQQGQHEGAPPLSAAAAAAAAAANGPAHHAAMLRQAPFAARGASPPQQQRSSAARHHLQQYLASIGGMGYVDELAEGVRAGNRLAVSRSLTLCESSRPDHALQAAALLRKLIDHRQQRGQQQQQPGSGSSAGGAAQAPAEPDAAAVTAAASPAPALRVGLSGPPGAGKSSLIETWGCYLADHGSRVAVLAVDPSSAETGGAILGDKTRMARLSSHPNAYVRPSPARGTLGGVSRATYDAMVICEAAGYDRVLVETVGVGQSEVAVADLVDCMVLVMPPVGGDDLQAIKRGIMEVADVVLVNKADGSTEAQAMQAAAQYGGSLHLMPHRYRGWEPQVLPVSAHTGRGVPALARLVADFQHALTESGELEKCRTRRAEAITWLSLEEQLLEGLRHDRNVRWLMGRLLPWVRGGAMAPRSAADITLSYFYEHCGP